MCAFAAGCDGDGIPGALGVNPGQVFFRRAGIDDQAVVCRREKIDNQIIDDAAVFIEQAGIQRAARGGQFGNIVRQQMAQKARGICTADIHGAHVRDVEQADIAAHGMVFFNL